MKRFVALLLALALCLCALPALSTDAEDAVVQEGFELLEYGSQGDAVIALQQKLSDLGYYAGKISGNFLEGTRVAVRRFQKDYGLENNGLVDEETYGLVMAAEYRTLKNGDDGDGVTRLQEHLISLGYLNTNATGKFRAATEGAVREFQKQNGLEATGEADLTTQQHLFSGNALPKGVQPTPTPNPDADLGDINDVVMVDDGASTADSQNDQPFRKRLIRGSQGDAVKQVQTRLTELGFFDGPISGYYMDQTIAAVKALLLHNGMSDRNDMDEETWNLLFNTPDVVTASATPKPSPVPTPVPYSVTVDVRNQVTTVYSLDETGQRSGVVKQMICSTGINSMPSDVGDWVTTGRRARWAFFSLYGSHAQYWTAINENIAFHSVIYNDVDTMKLSVKSYNKLGQRASHGCIRLLVSDAKWIYENITKGITVTVTEDLPLDQELHQSLMPPPLNRSIMWPSTTPQPTPEPAYTADGMPSQPFRKLEYKSKGEDVYWLQRRLKDLGYYQGACTGEYWQGTKNAVRAYQKDHGISGAGVATVKTQEALYAEALEKSAAPEPTVTPAELLTPAPEPSPTPGK